MRSLFCIFGLSLLSLTAIQAQKITDALKTTTPVKIEGYVGQRLNDSYDHRIKAQDVDKLISPFRNRTEERCWQSEFWGKWFTSAVLAYQYHPTPELKKILDQAVAGLIATQTPDGYIGNYAPDKHLTSWDIWGRKYCMLGLLAYHDITGDAKSLKATVGIADHLMKELQDRNLKIVKLGNHRGMAASSVLEPICLLYRKTGEKRFLDFAEEIVKQWESEDGPALISKANLNVGERFPKPKNWFGWEQGQKAYEMMSCYEGLLELYRITGKPEYLKAVESTWQNIRDTEINIAGSGSAVEAWFGGKQLQANPIFHYQETCVTVTWIKLSQQLLRITADTRYADAIEQTYYNSLLGSMSADGSDWAKYTPLTGKRMEGSEQCGMGLNCCTASGPRGLFVLPQSVIMAGSKGPQINFYVAGEWKLQSPGKQLLLLTQETDYPKTGIVKVKVSIPKPEKMTISLRVPNWSKQTQISVNQQPVPGQSPESGSTTISREWKNGDVIEVNLDMTGRIVRLSGTPEQVAIVRGPVVLTRDTRLGSPDVDEIIIPATEKDGSIKLEPVSSAKGIWMEFKAPFILQSYKESGNQTVQLGMCDYASAGNTMGEDSRFRVWFPQLLDPRK